MVERAEEGVGGADGEGVNAEWQIKGRRSGEGRRGREWGREGLTGVGLFRGFVDDRAVF